MRDLMPVAEMKKCYCHKSFPYQRLSTQLRFYTYRGPGNSEIKWPIANYKPGITLIKMPTQFPMTLYMQYT